MKKLNSGFNLLELLIALAITGILLMASAPGILDFVVNTRIASQTNDFVAALAYTRSEALGRGRSVSLTSVGGDWANGFLVQQVSNGQVIRSYPALSGAASLSATGGATAFTFGPTGLLGTGVDVLELCHGADYTGRTISITGVGVGNVEHKNDCS